MGTCQSCPEVYPRISKVTKFEDINKHYSILSYVISRSKNSIIRQAIDSNGKKYAVKTIDKRKISSVEMLKNEIEISTSLSHENIIKYYNVYENNSKIHIVMDYIDGGDLFDFITNSKQRKCREKQSIDIFYQIASVLYYLHNKAKVIHRDIKPENFLIKILKNKKPQIKLIDFGLACRKSKEITLRCGTEGYFPPEYYTKSQFDEKVDIWAAGLTLLNLLTGAHPFSKIEGKTPLKEQILNKKISFDVISYPELKALCMKMLERDPEKRISAEGALKALDKIKQKVEHSTTAFSENSLDYDMDEIGNIVTVRVTKKNKTNEEFEVS